MGKLSKSFVIVDCEWGKAKKKKRKCEFDERETSGCGVVVVGFFFCVCDLCKASTNGESESAILIALFHR